MIASPVSLAVGLGHMFDGGWVWWMWLMMAVGMGAMLLVFIAAVWLLVRAVKEVAGTPERRRREDRA